MTAHLPIRRIVLLLLGLAALGAGLFLALRGPDANAATSVRLRADPSGKLRFDKTRATITHGKVTLTMSNPSNLPHGIAVEGKGIDKDGKTVTKGGTSRVTVTLKRGTYAFYCPVDGHRKAGMQGKLTVR